MNRIIQFWRSFGKRSEEAEWMDDMSINDERLTRALDDLRLVNRYLGGYSNTLRPMKDFLMRDGRYREIKLLDIGTGAGDWPEFIVRWANRRRISIEVTGTDIQQATIQYADMTLSRKLPGALRARVKLQVADALALPYEDNAFDISTASLFLHHMDDADAATAVREMQRVSRHGLVVNDLHRHPVAYHGFKTLSATLGASPMVRHDGPLSVRRAFSRADMHRIAASAGITNYRLEWSWAFRWVFSTLEGSHA